MNSDRARVARNAFLLTLPIVILTAGIHSVNELAFDTHLLTFSGEGTIPAAVSAGMFAVGGVIAARASIAEPEQRFAWVAVAALSLLFAAEELALHIHERIEDLAGQSPLILVLEALLGLVLALVLWRPLARLPWPAPQLLLGAAGMLTIAQLVALAYAEAPDLGQPQNLVLLLEECGEMLMASLVVAAAAPSIWAGDDHTRPAS